MNLIISNASGLPIYEQIVTQIKGRILSGALEEGEMLPSIRALAKDLRISVITTKRAYDELEREGLICTVAGKGCFVAARNPEWVREGLLREIEGHMQKIAQLAVQAGIRGDELCEMFHALGLEDGDERD
ncbi:MAG: GntR family transcriptional regulator [Clostridia bacterium]|nr:GntR family transcriptional regulator [Clostridia bacterium]